jgi:hypothetical protein
LKPTLQPASSLHFSRSAIRQITEASTTVKGFARHMIGIHLYPYQLSVANAIIKSVFQRDGNTFVIIFSRQSGKDEILAVIYLFLMARFIEWGVDIVAAQPTFKPQTINAMERLKKRGINFGRRLTRTAGYIMRLGQARTSYFSAEPTANQVGATADRLLVMNEAQDIDPAVFDKRFAPMAASGFATKVFSGTSWTSNTLLAREKRAALEAEKRDGIQRVFIITGDDVGRINSLYARHVASEIQKLGRNHPLIRTQYFCEEIDAQVGMFNASRRALMQADQEPHTGPLEGQLYAFLLDIAGQDESRMSAGDDSPLANPGRDSVSLTIATIDTSTLATLQAPTYRFVNRMQWTGLNHLVIFGQLQNLVQTWIPQYIVIDATGVGEGLWAMLDKSFPTRVIPVKFSQQVKSEIGWRYLAIIETGRARDLCLTDPVRLQYDACQSEILPGPGKILRWGVPEGTRSTDGELIHDDIILSDALIAILDRLEWSASTNLSASEGFDPLDARLTDQPSSRHIDDTSRRWPNY